MLESTGWWFQPSEKYESQLGWLFPIYGEIKFMFQTTNQSTNWLPVRRTHGFAPDSRALHWRCWLHWCRPGQTRLFFWWTRITSSTWLYPFSIFYNYFTSALIRFCFRKHQKTVSAQLHSSFANSKQWITNDHSSLPPWPWDRDLNAPWVDPMTSNDRSRISWNFQQFFDPCGYNVLQLSQKKRHYSQLIAHDVGLVSSTTASSNHFKSNLLGKIHPQTFNLTYEPAWNILEFRAARTIGTASSRARL